MKSRAYIGTVFLITALTSPSRAQSPSIKPSVATTQNTALRWNSGVILPPISAKQIDHLAVLGKVWGFVKYYHPAVGAGKYDLDTELFRLLPQVAAATSVAERSQLLSTWLLGLGDVPACAKCAELPNLPVKQQVDLSWITHLQQLSPELSPELSKQLIQLRDNRHQGPGYYVTAGSAGNAVFTHEQAYATPTTPDVGLRLLALFRYWNMVQYFYPDRHLIGEDWNEILPAFIPRFVAANTGEAYRLAILELTARIHDTHATLSDKTAGLTHLWGDYLTPGLVSFISGKPVYAKATITTLAAQCPLQKGDIITRVDGVPVADLIKRQRPLISASNEAALLAAIGQNLLRGNTPVGKIEVLRAGRPQRLLVPRYQQADLSKAPLDPALTPKDSSYQVLSNNIGYVHLGKLTAKQVPVAMQALKDTQGIILDLRTYPDFAVFRLLPTHFVTQPTAFAKFTMPDLTYPGRMIETKPLEISPTIMPYMGKVVVMVNEVTLSLAEYMAMALQANPRATIMGSTTAGADGNVTKITLPGDLITRFSGLSVLYPDGRETQRVGIVPQVNVQPTVEGVRAKHDEVLERAIQTINAAK
ncbi:S41 family peptidase [Hymenobacter rubripertinctus]|uniref:Peptidase S41 n=1 Tax=Hymenobacter rubripertinctus TaxID=2029981 RepID=A0A418QPM6_9BACT|nr:S41 family peptidase [Hymenobacter rubripertinctus]RIY07149.1 peptidase S41 [Hymenobacter rubripertinctus]